MYTGQLLPPENVSACVTYQDNDTLFNVQWDVSVIDNTYTTILTSAYLLQIMGSLDSSSTFYIINYFSNESGIGFENSIILPSFDFRNRTNILIPANFTGKQLQVQVTVGFVGRKLASEPLLVGKSYIYYVQLYIAMQLVAE